MASPRDDPSRRTVHDAASVARERLHGAVAALQSPLALRHGLRDGWDALVRVAFAPCVGDAGARAPAARPVPCEATRAPSRREPHIVAPPGPPRSPTPRERRAEGSRARLRQLGARHRLATGRPGPGLAAAARPASPREAAEAAAAATPDLVDFDDGISALSAHTLDEMARGARGPAARAVTHVVRLDPRDFAPVVEGSAEAGVRGTEEGADAASRGTEASRAAPPYDPALLRNVRTAAGPRGARHLQFSPTPPAAFPRVATLDTAATEETHEFEALVRRQEALYWRDADRAATAERGARAPRRSGGPGAEARARRLRELSRSRSRSDGAGSHKSGGSLLSGPHPHDTFPRRRASKGGGRRSPPQGRDPAPGGRAAAASEYGEI